MTKCTVCGKITKKQGPEGWFDITLTSYETGEQIFEVFCNVCSPLVASNITQMMKGQ